MLTWMFVPLVTAGLVGGVVVGWASAMFTP